MSRPGGHGIKPIITFYFLQLTEGPRILIQTLQNFIGPLLNTKSLVSHQNS